MGVLNVTADSFSDGGRFLDRDRAVEHGLRAGRRRRRHRRRRRRVDPARRRPRRRRESSSPGWSRCQRPCRRRASRSASTPCAPRSPRAALETGAPIVNDVSGGRADPAMAPLVAEAGVPWVLMHWRSVGGRRATRRAARTATWSPRCAPSCWPRVDAAVAAGVDPAKLIIDPGLGFAKTAQHNWALLQRAARVRRHGYPGAGRRVAQAVPRLAAGRRDGDARPPDGRETATAVISALAAAHGAWGVRVHDVRAIGRRARRCVEAWTRSGAAAAMADRIELRGLTVRGNHGVFEHERRDGQDFVVDITVWIDLGRRGRQRRPGRHLRLRRAGAARGRHRRPGPPRNLIETVAAEIADGRDDRRAGARRRGRGAQAAGADPAGSSADVAVVGPTVRVGAACPGGRRTAMTPRRAVHRFQPRRPAGPAAVGGRRPRRPRASPSRRSTRPTRGAAWSRARSSTRC